MDPSRPHHGCPNREPAVNRQPWFLRLAVRPGSGRQGRRSGYHNRQRHAKSTNSFSPESRLAETCQTHVLEKASKGMPNARTLAGQRVGDRQL
eukprot:3131207-Pyramimonas_sp.AAC.1